MALPEPLFVPRPWPERSADDSPLRGRRVLVVDRDLARGRELAAELARAGCASQCTDGGARLDDVLGSSAWEVVLADVDSVPEPLRQRLASIPSRPTWILTGAAHAEPSAEKGAAAFLAHGDDFERTRITLGRALERRVLEAENQRLRDEVSERFALQSFVTHDPALRRLLATVESVADTKATVLLLGESGTGKTRLARAIHEHSSRARRPFVVVNCGALPDTLLASELFGHVRGAFTGAVRDRPGKFEQADGGTILLDEINSASPDLQVKLLRVLQDRTFERVGDTRTRTADVRVIAASNRDLEEETAAGRFREDLYYRLHVVRIALPPLRERQRDVAHLAEHFLQHFARLYRKPIRRLSPECLSALVAHPWPGNVRQLENAIERAVLLSSGTELEPGDLGEEAAAPASPEAATEGSLALGLRNLATLPPLKRALEGPERDIILRALELNGGNRQKTADMLQVNRTTLFNKMKKYSLMDLTFEGGPATS